MLYFCDALYKQYTEISQPYYKEKLKYEENKNDSTNNLGNIRVGKKEEWIIANAKNSNHFHISYQKPLSVHLH